MKFWPRSLFWRSAFLIGSLLVVSQIGLSIAFYVFVQRPRLDFAQDLTLVYLDNVRAALTALPPVAREKFLSDVDPNSDLRVTRESPKSDASAIARQPLVRVFVRDLQERLPRGERVIVQETPVSALWVSLLVNDEPYWIVVGLAKLRVDGGAALLVPFSISLVLAAIGGVLIHRSLNRPLAKLQHFAAAVGRGERPPLIDSQGPREIVSLGDAFNRMARDLDSLDSDRRLMLAGVSHDLRTPVTRLRLALEVAGEHIEPEARERMEANLRELDSSLSQFLDFARSERDEAIVETDLFDIANECVATYEAHGHSIALVGMQGTCVPVRPLALMRALTNLVDNSLKYSTGEIEIEVSRVSQTGEPMLVVRDRGAPLHAIDFARLRKPFARMNESRSGPAGTGLGLAIVERIANLHNAALTFTARDGGGLEVRMQFRKSDAA
jgi:two-component system, OmpR family, osmolarity sensor histidine kinase EnvZ